jgi:CrcB protein
MATLTQLRSAHRLIRPFVGVGVLGGFTTFSTMAVDAERLIADQRAVAAGLYLVCTLVAAALAMIIATSAVQLTGPYLRGRLQRGGAQHERHSQGAERARGDADD